MPVKKNCESRMADAESAAAASFVFSSLHLTSCSCVLNSGMGAGSLFSATADCRAVKAASIAAKMMGFIFILLSFKSLVSSVELLLVLFLVSDS